MNSEPAQIGEADEWEGEAYQRRYSALSLALSSLSKDVATDVIFERVEAFNTFLQGKPGGEQPNGDAA